MKIMKKNTSKIYSHLIDKKKHAHFLAQKRQDSITHEIIEEGEHVVFCQVCKSVFTVDSWQYIGRSHCHQSQTLKKVPTLRSLSLDKKKIEKRKKIAFYKKYSGSALMSIFILIGVFGMMATAINTLTSPAKSISVQGISITEKHYISHAKKQYQAQNFSEAQNYYTKALNINPSNTEALRLLEQLENEYLFTLEEADRFFKAKKYNEAKHWYTNSRKYKPNSEYPTKQLLLITQAEAETPTSFIKTEELDNKKQHSILKKIPKEWEVFINKNEKLYFWTENLQKTEVLLSYENGLVELRSLKNKEEIKKNKFLENAPKLLEKEEEKKLKFGKLLTVFQGAKMPQATFVYPELFLKEFEKLEENEKENLAEKLDYEAISVISKGYKIYYYTLDRRGARQVNEFSTFHFKKNEKIIMSENGKYFLIQSEDKLLHLYDTRNKTLLKSMRTNEHKPFIGNAFFDIKNNEIIATTTLGQSKWQISK